MTVKTYLPPGIDAAPTTPAQALAAARAVIEEEGRWAKDTWYQHHNEAMPEFRDDPFCNGWETCAAGALLIVTVGMTDQPPEYACNDTCKSCNAPWRFDDMPPEYDSTATRSPAVQLYYDALRFLGDAVEERNGDHDRWGLVPRFNDNAGTTRADVLEVFRNAEAKALAAQAVPA